MHWVAAVLSNITVVRLVVQSLSGHVTTCFGFGHCILTTREQCSVPLHKLVVSILCCQFSCYLSCHVPCDTVVSKMVSLQPHKPELVTVTSL